MTKHTQIGSPRLPSVTPVIPLAGVTVPIGVTRPNGFESTALGGVSHLTGEAGAPNLSTYPCRACDGAGEVEILALDARYPVIETCSECDGSGLGEPVCETCEGGLTANGYCLACDDFGVTGVGLPEGWNRVGY